jgi:hypothetical protein
VNKIKLYNIIAQLINQGKFLQPSSAVNLFKRHFNDLKSWVKTNLKAECNQLNWRYLAIIQHEINIAIAINKLDE